MKFVILVLSLLLGHQAFAQNLSAGQYTCDLGGEVELAINKNFYIVRFFKSFYAPFSGTKLGPNPARLTYMEEVIIPLDESMPMIQKAIRYEDNHKEVVSAGPHLSLTLDDSENGLIVTSETQFTLMMRKLNINYTTSTRGPLSTYRSWWDWSTFKITNSPYTFSCRKKDRIGRPSHQQ